MVTDSPETNHTTVKRGPGFSWLESAVLAVAFLALGALAVPVVGALSSSSEQTAIREETDPDVGFLHDMINHHSQALEMSNIALTNGSSPEIEVYAREILLFQAYEMGLMTSWLADLGHTPTDGRESAMEWMGMMGMPVESMPGMASEADLAALQAATGEDADRLFFELMADHHRGGVEMALAAVDTADDARVVDLATRQARNQRIEIDEFLATADMIGLDVNIEPIRD